MSGGRRRPGSVAQTCAGGEAWRPQEWTAIDHTRLTLRHPRGGIPGAPNVGAAARHLGGTSSALRCATGPPSADDEGVEFTDGEVAVGGGLEGDGAGVAQGGPLGGPVAGGGDGVVAFGEGG